MTPGLRRYLEGLTIDKMKSRTAILHNQIRLGGAVFLSQSGAFLELKCYETTDVVVH
jgi:hypothetical protein